MQQGIRQLAVLLSLLFMLQGGGLVAQVTTGVSGTVRDQRGKPQMGVLIELVGASTSAASALTDLQGHYQIRDVIPGIYQLRATATLYIPTLRRQIRIQASMRPIVNLTMSSLFDEASWMSSAPSDEGGAGDDWSWTLRSPANRPMLRLAEDGSVNSLPASERGHQHGEAHGALRYESRGRAFGASGNNGSLTIAHRSEDQKRTLTLRSLAAATGSEPSESPLSLSMLMEEHSSGGTKRRVGAGLRTFPQVRDVQGNPLMEAEFASAERLQIGDMAAIEVGNEAQFLRAGDSVLIAHPFLRLTSSPIEGWTATYAYATSPNRSRFDDLGRTDDSTPTVIPAKHGLLTEAQVHQEVAARRKLGRTQIQLIYQQDQLRRTALSGKLRPVQSVLKSESPQFSPSSDMSLDVSNGTFRLFAPGFSASGFGVAMDIPLGNELTFSGGFFTGAGVKLRSGPRGGGDSPFLIDDSKTVLAAVKGRITKTGTRVSVSYRWQPEKMVSPIAPYEMSGAQPYLGVHLRQPISVSRVIPAGCEIFVDGDNLLGEGYQNYAIGQQEAILASAIRDLRAGIAVTF